ncbi:MAG: hypothetical protein HS111_31375 [Kofleriaceae bacterium]|nr:hypothetical protein [Kofleriaceae bacterium]
MDPVLVCPACRTRTAERIDLRTLEPVAPGGELLACACGRRYPVVDGVPIVCADPAGFLRDPVVLERDPRPRWRPSSSRVGPMTRSTRACSRS